MKNRLAVAVREEWAGQDDKTSKLCELRLVFPDAVAPKGRLAWRLSAARSLERAIQPIVDSHFGEDIVKVSCTSLVAGSIEAALSLTTLGGAAIYIIKNYSMFRKEILQIIDDIEALDKYLSGLMRRHTRKASAASKTRQPKVLRSDRKLQGVLDTKNKASSSETTPLNQQIESNSANSAIDKPLELTVNREQ
jgi:hypothetical protein